MPTTQKCKTDTCCSPEDQCPPKEKPPTIHTTGTAVRKSEPTGVTHTVEISAEGEDRRTAMANFQEQLKAFTECLDPETDHTLSPLRETSETIGEGRREVDRTVDLLVVNASGKSVPRGSAAVKLKGGAASMISLVADGLSGPFVQGELRLRSSDPLASDDVAYFTVAVASAPPHAGTIQESTGAAVTPSDGDER